MYDAPTPTDLAPGNYTLVEGVALGEYRIESKIGEGGMGTVYAAIHPVIGKRVAVKVLKRAFCEELRTVERFVDEARAVNRIQHPNIVDIFAFGEMPDGRLYMVMELLEGESLRARMERGKPAFPDALAIIEALARALAAAHEQSIIHRDIKPENVYLLDAPGESPRVKLLDFGLAKLIRDPQMSLTATGELVGTPQYISPEQARGSAVDGRADIYSLGCVAFELVTGRPPFLATSAMEVVAKHLMEEPEPPSRYARALPRALDATIFATLDKDPARRPSLAELCRVLANPDARPPRRRAPWVLAGALGLVVLAGGVTYYEAERGGHTPVASAAEPAPKPTPPAPAAAPEPVPNAPMVVVAEAPAPPPRRAPPARASKATIVKKPAAAVSEGRLQLTLRGARGAIAVDGTSYGTAGELALALAPGPHRVAVTFPNEATRVVTVQVSAGEVTRRDVTAMYVGAPKGDELLNPNSVGPGSKR
jgi:eukaryotic-like serine/threonine-protein kinase